MTEEKKHSEHKTHKKTQTNHSVKKTKSTKSKKKSTNSTLWIVLGILGVTFALFAMYNFLHSTDVQSSDDIVATANKLSIEPGTDAVSFKVVKTGDQIYITKTEYDYAKLFFEMNSVPVNESELLKKIVFTEELYDNAKKYNYTINESVLNAILSNPAFAEKLGEMNLSLDEFKAKYSDEFKKELYVQEFLNSEILEKLPVQKAVDANHILICYDGATMCEENRTKEEALDLANQIYAELGSDASLETFETMAKEYSDGPSGINGGSLGTFQKGQMVKEFEDMAFSLNEGQVSEPVETQFGYHIIRVNKVVEVPAKDAFLKVLYSLDNEIFANADIQSN